MNEDRETVVLVVGQTPPPHHGQSIMIEAMLQGAYPGLRLVHARMAFSDDLEDVSRFRVGKIFHLFGLIARVVALRLQTGASILYYPPAPAARVPLWRDFFFLLSTRWMFRRTVFHFHAGGVSTLYPTLSAVERFLFRRAYFYPDLVIRISRYTPEDGRVLRARREVIVPNGIADECGTPPDRRGRGPDVQLLYVGALSESKGIGVLLEACRKLTDRNISFQLKLVGDFTDPVFRQRVHQTLADPAMQGHVTLAGVLTGQARNDAYRAADIFVFPSFFPAETFGLVVVEAMSFALPVVATNWSGIPDVVADGQTGRLVPPRDAEALSESLRELILDPQRREEWGQAGRRRFLDEFTVGVHCARLGACLREVDPLPLETSP